MAISRQVHAADKETTVATAGDIRPFAYQNKKGHLTVYDIQVIKEASNYIDGYEINFKKTPWESIFVGMSIYQTAANNLSYAEERAERYLYLVPIAKNPLVLVVQNNSKITSLDDIGDKTAQDDTGTSTAQLITK